MTKVQRAGYNYGERDKQAMNEAAASAPYASLLKARLLFDGGYYTKALNILSAERPSLYPATKDKAEYYYRSGRINDALRNDNDALRDYQQAINYGKNLKYYYAATAALNMGKIYAVKNNIVNAKKCFNIAINMKNHEYENSIEAQARDGLRKLAD